jgi:8-amino-7-oxononanoate synthase/dethiobiotin synthase
VTRFVVVTGTDTGVGKTVVTAALAALAAGQGQRVAVVKPVQTGAAPGEPGDVDEVRRLSGVADVHEYARFPEPLAPATAARRAAVIAPPVSTIAARIRTLPDRDLVLIEGAGGLLVHLDADGGNLADLAALLAAPVLVVTRAGLGTLNATALTCEHLRGRRLQCLGVVIGAWPGQPDVAARCNLEDLPGYAGAPLLGRMPEGAGAMNQEEFAAAAAGLAPALRICENTDSSTRNHLPAINVGATLAELRRRGLYRRLPAVDSAVNEMTRVDGRGALVLCSNDYLGLRMHPAVRDAAAAAAARWGAGSGSSRLVAGNLAIHRELELALAEFKCHEACVLFGSGYLANTGIIPALTGPGEVILSDALNHASIVDGCRLAKAETIVYQHRSLEALADALRRAHGRPAVIVTDAVFSMDGDLAPLEGIVELARRYGARVLVDEAHATGVLGPGGRGLVAELGLEREVDVVVGTLSKALGSYGAFACCRRPTAEYLVNRARTLTFSTALPPAAAAAALAALQILHAEPTLIERLRTNGRLLRRELTAAGFSAPDGDTPIIALIVGDAHQALEVCHRALKQGVFAQAIRPPTVPEGTSRLRLTVAATHTEEHLRMSARALDRASRHLTNSAGWADRRLP